MATGGGEAATGEGWGVPSPPDRTLRAMLIMVSCMKDVSSMRSRMFRSRFSWRAYADWKVLGSMLGKSLSATGSSSSMKGTRTKKAKGTRRARSTAVRMSCLRSRRERRCPPSTRRSSRVAVRTSETRSLLPSQ